MDPYVATETRLSSGDFVVPKSWPSPREIATIHYTKPDHIIFRKLLLQVDEGLPYETALKVIDEIAKLRIEKEFSPDDE